MTSEPEQRLRLLLVEDDATLSGLLTRLLAGEGYDVTVARDGHTGLHEALTRPFDLMVVDRGLPAIEGLDLVRRLRARGIASPILVLTARGTSQDRVEGLDAGAEDYVIKPFDLDELLARLRALLRRHPETSTALPLGERMLDVETQRVVGGAADPVSLSTRECELLRLLALQPRRVFAREELRDRVFPATDSANAVDTYVYYLRRKLGRESIRTVRGVGYQLGSA